MATQVYETVEVTLLDGTDLEMSPLKISLLRKFMATFDRVSKMALAEDDEAVKKPAAKKAAAEEEVRSANDQYLDILMDCALIALEQYAPGKYTDRDALEDAANLTLIYRIIEAASGIQLDDSGNVLAAGILG